MKNFSIPYADSALFKAVLFVAMMFSYYATFGARVDQGDSVGEALLYATLTTVLTAFLWMVVLAVFPILETLRARLLAAVLIVVLCTGIGATSGLQNQIKLSGDQALGVFAEEVTTEHETSLRVASRNSVVLQDLIPILRRESDRYAVRAKNELENGAYTGSAGAGSVFDTLQDFSRLFAGLADQIEMSLEKVEAHRLQAAAILATMRKIARTDTTHDERVKGLAKASEAFRVVIGKLNSKGDAIAVQFAVDNMAGELNLRSQLSKNRATAERQKAAIARIRNDIADSAQTLMPYVANVLATKAVEPPFVERINAQEAVIRFAHTVVPGWMIALLADLFPVMFLAIGLLQKWDRGIYGTIGRTVSLTEGLEIYKTVVEHHREVKDNRPIDVINYEIATYKALEAPAIDTLDTGENDASPAHYNQRANKTPIVNMGGEDENS